MKDKGELWCCGIWEDLGEVVYPGGDTASVLKCERGHVHILALPYKLGDY